jgi:divalent metal cation (Fe/Co/Zn/Cd) transporter
MVTGSTFVILVALAGNLAIAIAKFVASWISGSTAMYTEAIHSLVDTGDQILLLIGQKRGERPPDARHPLGHGMETYFWSFIVALMVFLLGGVLSVYEGVRQILEPRFRPGSAWGCWQLPRHSRARRSASPIGNTVVSCADGPPASGTSSRHRRTRHS